MVFVLWTMSYHKMLLERWSFCSGRFSGVVPSLLRLLGELGQDTQNGIGECLPGPPVRRFFVSFRYWLMQPLCALIHAHNGMREVIELGGMSENKSCLGIPLLIGRLRWKIGRFVCEPCDSPEKLAQVMYECTRYRCMDSRHSVVHDGMKGHSTHETHMDRIA